MKTFSFLFAVTLVSPLYTTAAFAEIVLDGSMGSSGAIAGPNFAITSDFGQQRGANLFHSFSSFNLVRGDIATFSGPGNVNNIISRVTGGTRSSIDGKISSTISGANMFLVNPSGIIFGPNAKLDVSGSFAATTADYLKLDLNGRFDATTPENSVLTADPPAAFGFTSATPGSISIQGSDIAVPLDKSLSLVGGDITGDGARIQAPGGQLILAAVRSAGEVTLNNSEPTMTAFTALGEIDITNDATLSVIDNTNGAGTIYIRGGKFYVDAAKVEASNSGAGDGGTINVQLSQDLIITSNGLLAASKEGEGRAGKIEVQAKTLELSDGGHMDVASASSGFSGELLLEFQDGVTISGYGVISSGLYATTFGSGDGGRVTLTAPSISLSDWGVIDASTYGTGRAGYIGIYGNQLALSSYSKIDVSSQEGAYGSAGELLLDFTDSILIDYFSGLYANATESIDGGLILVSAPSISISQDAAIKAASSGSGPAGRVELHGGQLELLSGGHIDIFSGLDSESGGTLVADMDESITISGKGESKSGVIARSYGRGTGGQVRLSAPEINLFDDGAIKIEAAGSGNGGSLTLQGKNLNINSGGRIDASTHSEAATLGGSVLAIFTESITIAGKGEFASGVTAYSLSLGSEGGQIKLSAPSITIADDGAIQSVAFRSGQGADINLHGDTLLLTSGGGIAADTMGDGQGGRIFADFNDAITISGRGQFNTKISASSLKDKGTAGQISLHSPKITVSNNAEIQSTSFRSTGSGGTVKLGGNILNLFSGGSANVSTYGEGLAGKLEINMTDSMTISGQGTDRASGLYGYSCGSGGGSGVGSGAGASISLSTANLFLKDHGIIFTSSLADGQGGNIQINTETLAFSTFGKIRNDAQGIGNAGNIDIVAKNAVILDGNNYFADGGRFTGITNGALEGSTGKGGNISIATPQLTLDCLAFVTAQTDGVGDGGIINLDVGTLEVKGGSAITTSTSAGGNAGHITINAGESVLVDGVSAGSMALASSIESRNFWMGSTGMGGDILLTTPQLSVANGGRFSVSTKGSGDGGTMTFDVGSITLQGNAQLTAESTETGEAGDIVIHATDLLRLKDSSITTATANACGGNIWIDPILVDLLRSDITTTVKGGTGDGGNIDIIGTNVLVDQSRILAKAEGGNGGNITINSSVLLTSPDSVFNASSRFGLQGSVTSTAPNVDIGGTLANLPTSFLSPDALTPKRCSLKEEDISSFTVTQESFPTPPDQGYLSEW